MQNRPNEELVALLTDPQLKEASGLQLLQQSPSIEDLKALIRANVQKYAAWNMLKERATAANLIEMIGWCDLKDELEEALLKFNDLGIYDLELMMKHGYGIATWQRYNKASGGRIRIPAMLRNVPCNDIIAEWLLSRLYDNDTLVYIIRCGTLNYQITAWRLLINLQPTVWQLGRLLDSDLKEEAWQLLLNLPIEKKDLHYLVMNSTGENVPGSNRAAAYLLATQPSREDLLCIVGYSSLWEPAWNELLKQGISNEELAELIKWTPCDDKLPWEQLKKQSPTCDDLIWAIDEEWNVYGYQKIVPEIAAYILTLNPPNDDLEFLIRYVPEIREQAIDRILQQNPSDKDMKLVRRYRPGA